MGIIHSRFIFGLEDIQKRINLICVDDQCKTLNPVSGMSNLSQWRGIPLWVWTELRERGNYRFIVSYLRNRKTHNHNLGHDYKFDNTLCQQG